MARHVFIDNSNLYGGAQRAAERLEPGAVWLAVRLYYRNLFQLLEHGDAGGLRVLAGSIPPGNDQLWDYARDGGYDTDLLKRVRADDGRLVEQGVDEMLHLKIANAVLDHPPPQTLVIASGDGRDSNFGTGFPRQAERALRQGWNVEVWSWQDQFTRAYVPLASRYPGQVHLNALDPHYLSITFVQQGDYNIGTGTISVAGRVVRRLEGP